MADSTGSKTPPTDPKGPDAPGPRSGPVRPPVLEGTARSTASRTDEPIATGKKEPGTGAGQPEPPKPASATRPPASGSANAPAPSNGAAWLAGIIGGLLGLGAAYGLAWFGLWPEPEQAPPPPDPRLAQYGTAIPELQDRAGALQGEIAALGERLSGLEASIAELPAAAPADNGGELAEQLSALAAEVERLAAAPPPPAPANGDAEAIAALEARMNEALAAGQDNAARIAEIQGQLAALSQAASVNEQTSNQAARLPLIFSALESAFASGRSYETELAALRRLLPSLTIPEALSASAANGLPRPDEVARRLDAVIPDMLAGRPAASDAAWTDGAMDWLRGIIAIRPTGEIEGDGPEAGIARLEAAVARRDFAAAASALAALPQSMRAAAGDVGADIARLASAQSFLADLRDAALRAENGA